MRIYRFILMLALVIPGPVVKALENEVSIGMAAPSPTGLSFKVWTSRTKALQFLTAWSTDSDKFLLNIDYLNHDFRLIDVEPGALPFYYGVGIRLHTQRHDTTKIGFRIPIGISYLMENAPIDFFSEIGPRVNFIPSTKFALDVMIGIRYRIIP